MGDIYLQIDSLSANPTPCVLFLSEDNNKQSIIDALIQNSINKSGSDAARLLFLSLNDIIDFTSKTIDYVGSQLICGDYFITFPGSILIFIDITAVEQYENGEYLSTIENILSYFLKDLTPFINNQTKIVLLLNLNANAPNSAALIASIKSLNVCVLENILCCYNEEELSANVERAEELCFSLNSMFLERQIRHLKKLKIKESDYFKNPTQNGMQLVNKWESLKRSYIGYIYELLGNFKEGLKNYYNAWELIKHNYQVYQLYDHNAHENDQFDTLSKLDSEEIIKSADFSVFTFPDNFYDIVAIRLIKLTIDLKAKGNNRFGSQLREIVQQYNLLISCFKAENLYEHAEYLYKIARLHYFIANKLPEMENLSELKLEFFKFRPYHMFNAARYTYLLHKLIKLNENEQYNLFTISYENGISALKSSISEFNNLGWSTHCYLSLMLLLKFYILANDAKNATDTFNEINQSHLFKFCTNIKQLNSKFANENDNLHAMFNANNYSVDFYNMWSKNWTVNKDILAFGKKISGNATGWRCCAMNAITGDEESINMIKNGVYKGNFFNIIPLAINLKGRSTLYLSEELALLVFRLNIGKGFYCNSGKIVFKIDGNDNSARFTFEPVITNSISSNGAQLHKLLIGLLEEGGSETAKMEQFELSDSEHYLLLTPFDNLSNAVLAKSKLLLLDLAINSDSESPTVFSGSIPLAVKMFTGHSGLIDPSGWPKHKLKYCLPYSKRVNSVIRTSVKLLQLTNYWINNFAPVILEFDVYNCNASYQDVKIGVYNCNLIQLSLDDSTNSIRSDGVNHDKESSAGGIRERIRHFKYQLNITHLDLPTYMTNGTSSGTRISCDLTIEIPGFDILNKNFELNYTNGVTLDYRKEIIVSETIGIGDFVNYFARVTNLTGDILKINKLTLDSNKSITPGECGLCDKLLPNESCVVALEGDEIADCAPAEIKMYFNIGEFESFGIKTPIDWLIKAQLRNECSLDMQGMEIRCASATIANVGVEFDYQSQITNNTCNTQELQLKLNVSNPGSNAELIISGPMNFNIILLPFDSKTISWKIVSLVTGHIELPILNVEKKRWIHSGDDQPMETRPVKMCILPASCVCASA